MDDRTRLLQELSLREAQGADQLTSNAQTSIWAIWLAALLRNPYSAPDVDRAARESIRILTPAREHSGNLGVAYVREVIAGLRYALKRQGTQTPTLPTAPGVVAVPLGRQTTFRLPEARNGADLVEVYSRPAEEYRREFSVTGDQTQAIEAAHVRLNRLIEDDVLLARRDGEHHGLTEAGIDEYRRIVHPERSIGGVCGLCLAASDRIYKVAELLPIHGRCKCTVAPITDDYDPGEANEVDLEAIYEAAGGSTDGRDLKKTRWQVDEHGELGPVLTRAGDRFQSKGAAPKGDPAERARRELAALEPVLADLETRAAAGDDVAAPLEWQRNRVAKLRAIAGA